MNKLSTSPTLKEILVGYKQFNEWESAELARTLPELSIDESINQFFQLCALTVELAPDASFAFLNQEKKRWIQLKNKRQKAAGVMGYARTVRSLTPGESVSR